MSVVKNLFSGDSSAKASSSAANAQVAQAKNAINLQKQIYNTTRSDYMPFQTAGYNALSELTAAILGKRIQFDANGRPIQGAMQNVAPQDRLAGFFQDPGYQFRMNEGTRAIENSASARGNLYSGATMKALQRYGQDYASNEYDNYLSRLSGIAGSGQQSINSLANIGSNYATNTGKLYQDIGDSRASGYIGVANARNQAGSNILNVAGRIAGFGGF